jgi:hypothetical protein
MMRQRVSQIMPSALVVGYKSSVLETAWAKTVITTYGHTIILINALKHYTSGGEPLQHGLFSLLYSHLLRILQSDLRKILDKR